MTLVALSILLLAVVSVSQSVALYRLRRDLRETQRLVWITGAVVHGLAVVDADDSLDTT